MWRASVFWFSVRAPGLADYRTVDRVAGNPLSPSPVTLPPVQFCCRQCPGPVRVFSAVSEVFSHVANFIISFFFLFSAVRGTTDAFIFLFLNKDARITFVSPFYSPIQFRCPDDPVLLPLI